MTMVLSFDRWARTLDDGEALHRSEGRTAPAVPSRRVTRGRAARLGAAAGAVVLASGLFGLSGTAVAKEQPTVSLAKLKGVGNVLVDSNKDTLYTLVNNHQAVDCTGACLSMGFAPLTIPSGTKPSAGKGVKGLGVVAGGTQVTENGFPLFVFTSDKPHQANGQGLTSSGGTWHTPTVKAAKSKSSSAGSGGVSF
jgi:predicted lipoprotein with Yx(FWY)xxD motif